MKPTISHRKFYNLTMLGYSIIGAANNGFYQQRYFHVETLPPFVWIGVGLLGSVLLVTKNILGSNNKLHSALVDLCYILPVVLIPLIPARHDIMMVLMLVYICFFLILYGFKNYESKNGEQ